MDLKQYRSKLIGSEDERAVSPVIGVILMVAITVILAAVIAAFVLDMGSGQSQSAQAGVEINPSDSGTYSDGDYTVTITSMGDNTKTVKCSDDTIPSYSAGSVGSNFNCNEGDNIVGVTEDDEETVIQSDI